MQKAIISTSIIVFFYIFLLVEHIYLLNIEHMCICVIDGIAFCRVVFLYVLKQITRDRVFWAYNILNVCGIAVRIGETFEFLL